MASARPVVSTRLAGIPELVVEGQTGMLAPPGDSTALAHALEQLLGDREPFGCALGTPGVSGLTRISELNRRSRRWLRFWS